VTKPLSPIEQKLFALVGRYVAGLQTRLYRLTGGKLGGTLMNAPVLLLTTTGRKTGKQRTAPLLYLRDGTRLLIVASKGGFPAHPAWYLNLRDTPTVQVQLGAERKTMQAQTLSDEDKARVWPELVRMYKGYATYQARTERNIPVVALQ
jgi:deazaflavin-dependent oxidoreductase (nitroreductase family)